MAGSTVVPVEAFMVCKSVFDACTSTMVAVCPMDSFKFAVVCVPTLTTNPSIFVVEKPGIDALIE